jgi:hypothetical protein
MTALRKPTARSLSQRWSMSGSAHEDAASRNSGRVAPATIGLAFSSIASVSLSMPWCSSGRAAARDCARCCRPAGSRGMSISSIQSSAV